MRPLCPQEAAGQQPRSLAGGLQNAIPSLFGLQEHHQMLPSLTGRGTVPTAPGSHQPQLPGRAATHSERAEKGEKNAPLLPAQLPLHSLDPFCPCHALPDSRRCPEPWRSSVVSGSAGWSVAPQKLWDHLAALCPQAHRPRPGWPSLAGLSGFGCSHTCSDPAPGRAGCVTAGGVGGRRGGITHWSPRPSMSPGPAFGSHPQRGPSGVPS